MIFYEKTLEISTVILRDCLVKTLIKFDKYCKVDKCSGVVWCQNSTDLEKMTAKHIIFTRIGRF